MGHNSSKVKVGLYGTGLFGTDDEEKNSKIIDKLIDSHFNTIVLWAFHVGTDGSLVYNDSTVGLKGLHGVSKRVIERKPEPPKELYDAILWYARMRLTTDRVNPQSLRDEVYRIFRIDHSYAFSFEHILTKLRKESGAKYHWTRIPNKDKPSELQQNRISSAPYHRTLLIHWIDP